MREAVGLDSHDVEPVPLDQAPGDGRTGTIEFRGAMRRFAQQHDLGVTEPIKGFSEVVDLIDRGQGLAERTNCGSSFAGVYTAGNSANA